MPSSGVCLHIGCGLVVAPGWQNLDTSPSLRLVRLPLIGPGLQRLAKLPPWPAAVGYGDIVRGLPLKLESCDLVYASHMLEHLTLPDFHRAMGHIFSYLRSQGTFRAVVPDLAALVATYERDRQDPDAAPQAAHRLMIDSLLGNNLPRHTLPQRLRLAFANNHHQWMWDQASLAQAFRDQGYIKVRCCQYGDWGDRRFADVEHPESFQGAIAVEGIKP